MLTGVTFTVKKIKSVFSSIMYMYLAPTIIICASVHVHVFTFETQLFRFTLNLTILSTASTQASVFLKHALLVYLLQYLLYEKTTVSSHFVYQSNKLKRNLGFCLR